MSHNIKVPISGLSSEVAIRHAFDRDYLRRYGHADSRAAAEFQALHLSAFAKRDRPDLTRLPRTAARAVAATTRPVYFGGSGGLLDTQIYERAALAPGFKGEGPALLEEYGSTTIIWPGDCFEIGALGEIRILCAGN